MKVMGFEYKVFGGGMRKVEFVLPHVRGKRVLDVGVVQHSPEAYKADNWLHKHVREVASKCVGIDIVEQGIENLRAMGFDARYADAHNFNLGERFDVIVAGDIIEHLHDLNGFFASVRRHLEPGGKLVITTANPWFFVRCAQAVLNGSVYENPEHTCWYSRGTLTELLRRFGFDVTVFSYGSSEEFLERVPLMPDILRHTGIWAVAEPRVTS